MVGYRYTYGRRTVGCVVSDGRMTFRAAAEVPHDVGGRLGKRIRRALKTKVAAKIARAALRVAELYPGTAVAAKALRLGWAALKSAKQRRPLDVVRRLEDVPALVDALGDEEDDDR